MRGAAIKSGDRPTMAAAPPNVESGRCAGGRSCAHPAENRPVACAQLWEPPVVPSSTATVHSSPTAPSRALACRTTWLFARYPQLEQGLRRRTEITRRDVHTQRLSEPALGTRPCDGEAPPEMPIRTGSPAMLAGCWSPSTRARRPHTGASQFHPDALSAPPGRKDLDDEVGGHASQADERGKGGVR